MRSCVGPFYPNGTHVSFRVWIEGLRVDGSHTSPEGGREASPRAFALASFRNGSVEGTQQPNPSCCFGETLSEGAEHGAGRRRCSQAKISGQVDEV